MGWWENIFGGGETTQQSTSTPVDMNPFAGLRPTLETQLTQAVAQGGGPQYTGPMFSPETANEQMLRGGLMNTAGPGNQREGYTSDVLSGKYLGSNPFLTQAIEAAQRTTMQGLEETLGRTLPGRFMLAGQNPGAQGSSAFDRAAALATRGAGQVMGDIAAKMSFGAYEGERERQQQAVQLGQAEVETTIKNLQAQALPRLIQELGIERGMQLFRERSQQLLDVLKLLAGVTAPAIANQQQSTGESYTQKGLIPSIFPSGLFPGKPTP